MRLIDADALVAQMEEEAEAAEDIIAKMFIHGAISDVKHAPTIEPDPHWIPCNKRLPEWKTRVLFYLEKECYYDYPEPQYVTDWWIQEGLFDDKYGAYVYDSPDIGKGIPKDYVVAWMPLPKPWEGEK